MSVIAVQQDRLTVLTDEIRADLAELEFQLRTTVTTAVRAGERLIEAKELVKSEQGYGDWGRWLGENFAMTDRTARTYMSLARNRDRVGDAPTIREAMAALHGMSSEAFAEVRTRDENTLPRARFLRMVRDKSEAYAWDQIVRKHGQAKVTAMISQLDGERRALNTTIRQLKAAVDRTHTG